MAGEAAHPEEGPQAEAVVGAKDTRGKALVGAAALSQGAATREATPKGAAATSQAAATRGTTSGEAAAPRQAEATREATREEATSLAEGAIRVAVSSSCRYPPPAWVRACEVTWHEAGCLIVGVLPIGYQPWQSKQLRLSAMATHKLCSSRVGCA